MAKDKIFRKKQPIVDFNFKKETVQVFDDMLDRSVPFYQEIQRMTAEIAADFAVPGTNVYDLGSYRQHPDCDGQGLTAGSLLCRGGLFFGHAGEGQGKTGAA